MLPKVATLSNARFPLDKRGAGRRSLKLGFDTSGGQGRTRVIILDISATGMRIQTSALLRVGESLDLILPEAGSVTMTVVRAVPDGYENEFGVEFVEPINIAAISAVLLAAPHHAPPISTEEADQWIREARAKYPEVLPISDLLFVVLLVLVTVIGGAFVYAIGFLPVTG